MSRPVIETLATGDEVVNGDVVDSNSAFVSARLARLGLPLTRHGALPDDERLLAEGIREISGRADLCICSGGLGPTDDDLTADVVGRLLGVHVDIDEEAIRRMKLRFAEMNYKYTENNRRSARVPRGARAFQNDVGTAPAFAVKIGRCEFFFLPGVPREFRFFVEAQVLPWAESMWPEGMSATIQLKTLGWGESHLALQFEDFHSLFPAVKVGYRAHSPEVWVKFTAEAETRELALAALAPVVLEARNRIGSTIFGQDEDELPAMVHEKLIASGLQLVTAESCTGGMISQLLTGNAGSSAYFRGGVVAYSNDLKRSLLGVSEEVLSEQGAVSREVAEAMCRGALGQLGSDLALSVTGVAGPDGGTTDKPVGLVYLGIAWREQNTILSQVIERRFRGDRERVQKAAAYTALEMVRRRLAAAPALD